MIRHLQPDRPGAQRSGSGPERRSNETERMSGECRTERRGVCDDEMEQIEV